MRVRAFGGRSQGPGNPTNCGVGPSCSLSASLRSSSLPPAGDFTPTWFLDGSKIAFTSGRDWCSQNQPTCEDPSHIYGVSADFPSRTIYVMKADGSNLKVLTDWSISGLFPSLGPTASTEAIAAAPLPPAVPVGLAIGDFPTDDYTYREMIVAIASGDFSSVQDTPKARALIFSIMQQLHLRCDDPKGLPLRVPLGSVFSYAGAPSNYPGGATDFEAGFAHFFETILEMRTLAEQGDLVSGAMRVTGMSIMGGGFDPAGLEDGARLVENLGCDSPKLEQFWRNLSFVIGSRAQKTPSR